MKEMLPGTCGCDEPSVGPNPVKLKLVFNNIGTNLVHVDLRESRPAHRDAGPARAVGRSGGVGALGILSQGRPCPAPYEQCHVPLTSNEVITTVVITSALAGAVLRPWPLELVASF